MSEKFDVVVIGTGVAGSTVAHTCQAAGLKVAIVDSMAYGGTCPLRGCDPKRVLSDATSLLDWGRRMNSRGLDSSDLKIDWPALVNFKREIIGSFSDNEEKGLKAAGVACFHGEAAFVGKSSVSVADKVLEGRYVVVATGAEPARLGIPGEKYMITSADFMEAAVLPQRILFVGGGFISFEFAFVAASAGVQTHIVHQGSRPLEGFDADVVAMLTEAAREKGIEISLNSRVEAMERTGSKLMVFASSASGRQSIEADMVVHGAGRVPALDALKVEKAGIEREKKGIALNEYLQSTSNPSIYVVGDAAAKAQQLTPVAIMEGAVVAKNILEGNKEIPDYSGIPMVAFTDPPLAAVGLQEEEARAQGLKFKVSKGDSSSWYTARHLRVQHAGFKVLVEEQTQRILGAHLLGPGAEEAINMFASAIRLGLTAADLKRVIYSYPTQCFDINWEI
jgi:glutathione reductase (NADPH)